MPTYEFKCPNGHEFQKFYKTISGAPAELPCPKCSAVASRQLSGGAGLLFKGSGFYLTDYGKNAHRKAAPEAKSDGTKTDSPKTDSTTSGATKSETKSDTSTSSGKSESPKASAESSKPKAQSPKPPPKSE